MKIYSVLAVFLLGFVGCSNNIAPKKLGGTYHMNDDSLESITIFNNHTYKHVFRTVNEHGFENKGTWKYDPRTKQISFDYIVFQTDMPGGTWTARIKTTSKGEIHLIYSSEDDLYYVKIRSK